MKRIGLRARLGRLFAVQLTVIGLATLVGIYITQLIIEDLLTRQALEVESAYYWALYDADPTQPLPNTANMTGYLRRPGIDSIIPNELETLQPGYGRHTIAGRSLLVHMSDSGADRLYLLFEGDQVSDLAFYFGIVPLSIVLLLMYALLLIAYRWSQRALSPIVRLAGRLEAVDFEKIGDVKLDLAPLLDDADHEVAALIEAVAQFTAKLDAAIARETIFTRDAGHELRTPVAVFKGTLDLLEKDEDRPEHEAKALKRMRRSVDDMEALLETLLLLARDEELAPPAEPTLINDVVARQIETLHPLAVKSGNRITLHEQGELRLKVKEKVVEIVLGNLIRNALTYTTDGSVDITISTTGVKVQDSGIGMDEAELENAFEPFFRAEQSRESTKGHGLGLSIVRRLARQFGWRISIQSNPGEGTAVEVAFV